MTTKMLIAISVLAALGLIFVMFSAPGGSERVAIESADETFVERAARTRLNADASRSELEYTEEGIVERAMRTRASELVKRVESAP